jgi:hypothetical protein
MLRDASIVGAVPSDPTVSRVIDDLAAGGQQVLDAIADAHAAARARSMPLAADRRDRAGWLVPLDIDARW